MCRVWQAWVHMNHLVKGSICHILAQDPKVADFVLCFETSFALTWHAKGCCHAYRPCGSFSISRLKWCDCRLRVMTGAWYAFGLQPLRSSTSRGGGCQWSDLRGCHLLGGHPAWMQPADVAWSSREVSSFRGWDRGQGGGFWWPTGSLLSKLGKPWQPLTPSWTASWWRHMAVGCPLMISHLLAWKSSWNARGTSGESLMLQRWWRRGPAGSQGAQDGWTHVRTNYPSRVEAWSNPKARAQRALAGWLEDSWAASGPLPAACFWCGGLASKWCSNCGQDQCDHCLGRDKGRWRAAVWSGAATMLVAPPVCCGDEEEASASSRTALNASELVMSARVKEWRAQHFMENDDDFAYAFL